MSVPCFWEAGKIVCSRDAATSIGVKRGDRVIWRVDACGPHVHNATVEALDVAAREGGSVSTTSIDLPVRRAREPLVNASVFLPQSEHRRMVLAAQTQRMSLRGFVRAAINSQIRMFDLQGEAGSDDRQA